MDKVKNKNVVNNISMQIKDFSNESSFRAKIKERNIEPATLKNICNLKDIKSCLFEWTDFKSKVKPYYDIDLKLNFKPVDKYLIKIINYIKLKVLIMQFIEMVVICVVLIVINQMIIDKKK